MSISVHFKPGTNDRRSIKRQKISRVFMEELDRLFQPPLLPHSCSIQDPRVSPGIRPCEHDGNLCQTEAGRVCPALYLPACVRRSPIRNLSPDDSSQGRIHPHRARKIEPDLILRQTVTRNTVFQTAVALR
ncbi:hypothetical protein INR49_017522 [Caranx melampygus]|nr:hypothetical protein INR49_017522 [Caranx melampygus]